MTHTWITLNRLWQNGTASTVELRLRVQLTPMLDTARRLRDYHTPRRDWIEDPERPAHRCVLYCAVAGHERRP